jgi:glycerol-3-phosphate acyltransferase PlsX
VSPPALAAFFPTTGHGTVVLDVGANAEVKPSGWCSSPTWVRAWRATFSVTRTRVSGCLSIGEEEQQGQQLVQRIAAASCMAARHLNFIGPVEGRDVFKGTCDVDRDRRLHRQRAAQDRGERRAVPRPLGPGRGQRDRSPCFGALFLRGASATALGGIDWAGYGAAPLLGVNGVCFIGHGSSGSARVPQRDPHAPDVRRAARERAHPRGDPSPI